MQTVIRDDMYTVQEGLCYGSKKQDVTGIATELAYFGKGLSVDPDANVADTVKPVKLFTSGELFVGVAIADLTLPRLPDPVSGELNQAPYGAWSKDRELTYRKQGAIWVQTTAQLTDISKAVFVRNSDSAGTPATIAVASGDYDVDGNSTTITISGYAAQVISFPTGMPSTPAAVASEINRQLIAGSASVVSDEVVVTTDAIGDTATIAATNISTNMVWAAATAGTGDVASYPSGSRGSFTNDDAGATVASHTEITSGVSWLSGKTENGKYYGLLNLNL